MNNTRGIQKHGQAVDDFISASAAIVMQFCVEAVCACIHVDNISMLKYFCGTGRPTKIFYHKKIYLTKIYLTKISLFKVSTVDPR